MLLRQSTLDGIARGHVTLAFRRWQRPMVKSGTGLRTPVGVVRIGKVDLVDEAALTDADAVAAGSSDRATLVAELHFDGDRGLYRISFDGIEADPRIGLRNSGQLSEADWHELAARFERWDKTAPGHFATILGLIAKHAATPAAALAEELGMEKLKFKQDVRKLKEVGLTESLDVGYRLSPRGEAVLEKLREHRL